MERTILLTYTSKNGYDTFGWFVDIEEIYNWIDTDNTCDFEKIIECVDTSNCTVLDVEIIKEQIWKNI